MKDKLISAFTEIFAKKPEEGIFASAPGRVNLIGEHTDYNNGFVLPCAISMRTFVLGVPREDKKFRVYTLNLNDKFEVTVEDMKPAFHWSSYVLGPFYILLKEGYEIKGMDIVLFSEVPAGGGLSSSASIEVAVSVLIRKAFSLPLSPLEIALVAQKAENEYVTAPCGIMDQMASSLGKKGHALFIDCKSLEYEYVKIPEDWGIVVCDTGVKHSVAGEEYKRRQRECREGVEEIRKRYPYIESLRDVTLQMLEEFRGKMSDIVFRRCHYVIKENERVNRAVKAILQGDEEEVKNLFWESHEGLRSEYEVTCRELDLLVEIAYQSPHIIGARMTGAGFGGNTVNLVKKNKIGEFVAHIVERYTERIGKSPAVRAIEADDGAKIE